MTTFIPHHLVRSLVGGLAAAALTAGVGAQTPNFVSRNAADVPTVKGSPFSGQANITIKMTQYDGTRIERKLDGKYYRDSEGRVRREQLIVGLGLATPNTDSQKIVTIVDAIAGYVYTIVRSQREVQRVPMGPVSPPVAGAQR